MRTTIVTHSGSSGASMRLAQAGARNGMHTKAQLSYGATPINAHVL